MNEPLPHNYWTQAEAIALCKQIEAIAPDFGCHVALTGGLLYKDGPRKDADILLYRIRQADGIMIEDLFYNLDVKLGIKRTRSRMLDENDDPTYVGIWLQKATYRGKSIDFLFPDEPMADAF